MAGEQRGGEEHLEQPEMDTSRHQVARMWPALTPPEETTKARATAEQQNNHTQPVTIGVGGRETATSSSGR